MATIHILKATPEPQIYSDNFAPDLRFAALVLAVLGLVALVARRRAAGDGALLGPDWRVLAFFAIALALWLASSANGRYGMVVLLLSGLCLARVVARVLARRF